MRVCIGPCVGAECAGQDRALDSPKRERERESFPSRPFGSADISERILKLELETRKASRLLLFRIGSSCCAASVGAGHARVKSLSKVIRLIALFSLGHRLAWMRSNRICASGFRERTRRLFVVLNIEGKALGADHLSFAD